MMLKPILFDLVAQRVQEVVMRIMVRAEELVRLLDERPVCLNMLGPCHETLRAIRKQIEVHGRRSAGVQIEARAVSSGVQRTVNQGVEHHGLEGGGCTARVVRLERGIELPTRGQSETRFDRYSPREVACGVEHYVVPLDDEQIRAHLRTSNLPIGWREVLEVDIERGDA